jgi:glyoxylase-like metal-dependent hydrolase (beta-lactamase superfamily II)
MQLGKVEIQPISDGTIYLDGGMLFGSVPKAVWQRQVCPDELNRIPLALNSFLLTSGGKRILVDTGLGSKLSERDHQIWGLQREAGLVEGLRRIGLEPGDIDIVVNTHLHADHAGANTFYQDDVLRPSFPRAQYCIQEQEWEAATNPNEWSRWQYLEQNFRPLQEHGLLRLLDGDTPLTPEVKCILAPGHTPGHQCVVIESEGHWAVILGDAAPLIPHVERVHWLPSFDMAPMVNLETKKRLFQEARERRGLLLLFHDPSLWAGRLVEREGKLRLEKVA